MTRKDYIAIAALIARQVENQRMFGTTAEDRLHYVALDFCDVLSRDNPRFDEGRFMRAAFPNGVPVAQ